jgi:hypothetical protein
LNQLRHPRFVLCGEDAQRVAIGARLELSMRLSWDITSGSTAGSCRLIVGADVLVVETQ